MPYCPACYVERLEDRCACPLDGHYYRIARCPRCANELAPEDRFCTHCGSGVEGAGAEVVAIPRASWGSRSLALLVDLLCLSYVMAAFPAALQSLFWFAGPNAVRVLLALLPLGYFAFYQARGRQTIGQQVLGLAVLRSDRADVSLGRSLLRASLLCSALVGTLAGLLGILAGRVWAVSDLLQQTGLGPPWIPDTPVGQGVMLLLGIGVLAAALVTGRSLHDLAADTEVYAV